MLKAPAATGCLALILLLALALVPSGQAAGLPGLRPAQTAARMPDRRPPLQFEANQGQVDESVRFLARGQGHRAFFALEGMVLAAARAEPGGKTAPAVELRFVGAHEPGIEGLDPLPGVVNYYTGQDPTGWHTGVATFARIRYQQLYPGVDAVFYGSGSTLEHDFLVSPAGNPAAIEMAVENASALAVDPAGDLVVGLDAATVRLRRPEIYQDASGRRQEVKGGADASGRAYVTGECSGTGLPTTPGALQPDRQELIDAFVSVFDFNAHTYAYSSYLGGNGAYCGDCYSAGNGIAVDGAGMIYVTGQAAPNFPTTPNAYQRSFGGFYKAFLAVIDPTQLGVAGLLYATYLGGQGSDFGNAIALDATGKVYLAGTTQSNNFPTTPGAYDRTCGTDGLCNATTVIVCDPVPPGMPPHCHVDAKADAFGAKLDLSQSGPAQLVYSTYIGGSGQDRANGIALDARGNAYLAGATFSPDFPVVQPLQPAFGGGSLDAFAAKLNPSGSQLLYSTFLGGGGDDEAFAIATDGQGNACLVGDTGSAAFPTANAHWPRSGSWEAFVTKLGSGTRLWLPLLHR